MLVDKRSKHRKETNRMSETEIMVILILFRSDIFATSSYFLKIFMHKL